MLHMARSQLPHVGLFCGSIFFPSLKFCIEMKCMFSSLSLLHHLYSSYMEHYSITYCTRLSTSCMMCVYAMLPYSFISFLSFFLRFLFIYIRPISIQSFKNSPGLPAIQIFKPYISHRLYHLTNILIT